jgi:uncharacterized protein YceK
MNAHQHIIYLLPILFLLLLSGCATVPMESAEKDTAAKTFMVKEDKSNIYLYRHESFGGAVLMTVTLDGKVAGQTGPQTYFLWEVEPGMHEVGSVAENTSTVKLNTEAGKAYYIWQEVKMGMWMARTLLQQVDEETGRKGVNECKRAISSF